MVLCHLWMIMPLPEFRVRNLNRENNPKDLWIELSEVFIFNFEGELCFNDSKFEYIFFEIGFSIKLSEDKSDKKLYDFFFNFNIFDVDLVDGSDEIISF